MWKRSLLPLFRKRKQLTTAACVSLSVRRLAVMRVYPEAVHVRASVSFSPCVCVSACVHLPYSLFVFLLVARALFLCPTSCVSPQPFPVPSFFFGLCLLQYLFLFPASPHLPFSPIGFLRCRDVLNGAVLMLDARSFLPLPLSLCVCCRSHFPV